MILFVNLSSGIQPHRGGVLRNLIMPFGPLGDVADTAGPTTAEGIKSGQYTCFDPRTGASTMHIWMKGLQNMFRVSGYVL